MAKNESREPGRPDHDPEIAAAEGLFKDDSGQKSKHTPAPSAAAGSGTGETFDLADGADSGDLEPSTPIVEPPRVTPRTQARPPQQGKTVQSPHQPALEPSALVEQVWSRTAEWGPTLLVVGAWATFILVVVYFVLGTEYLWSSLLTLLLGGMVAVVLAYPIWITLERPVRMTPEQALRDYYGALSHHLPHFRRMWLLLSTAGRISTAYGSFEGFKAYWKDRLGTMRSGHAGALTPLVFEVADFKADKSAGKVRIDVEFILKVSVRGQRKAGAIHVIPMKIALVRGPDKMWYLENGSLAREGRTTRSTTEPNP
jgi:hypothetical protein